MNDPQSTELVAKLIGFSSAYPEDMFPPLTKAEIAELPRGILDRASAAMGRHVAKFAKEAADAVEAQHREIERLARELAEARAENEHRERYWAQFEHIPKSGPGRVEKLRAAGVRVTVLGADDVGGSSEK